jgi:hypothetical protein
MTVLCDLRKILRTAQARQDGGSLKVLAALKVSTACWGLTHQRIKITEKNIGVGDQFTLPSRFALFVIKRSNQLT